VARLTNVRVMKLFKNNECKLDEEATVARKSRDIFSDEVYAVKETLDLQNEDTAWHYIRRYAVQELTK
jgi:hypothetical protein